MKPGIWELCSTCTLRFLRVNIANESSRGTGTMISVVRGQGLGSRLEHLDSYGLRVVCPSTQSSLAIINSTQRSAAYPAPGGRQRAKAVDATYEVCCAQHHSVTVGEDSVHTFTWHVLHRLCQTVLLAATLCKMMLGANNSSSIARQHQQCCSAVSFGVFPYAHLTGCFPASAAPLTWLCVTACDCVLQGRMFSDMVHVTDISSDVPLQLVTGGHYVGGYALVRTVSPLHCIDTELMSSLSTC